MARRTAIDFDFIDRPDERKHHREAVPPIGGLVVIPVFLFVSILAGLDFYEHIFFVLPLILVWGVGAVDDKYHVSALTKFGIHLAAAVMLVAGNGTTIYYLGNLFGFGEIWTEPLAITFSVLCVVFIINAINMIDGLDGLCGGVMLIMLMALTCAAMILGGHEMVIPMFVLMGALSGFMIYNHRHPYRHRASLFMGDSGSTSLGLIISWLVIELSQNTYTMQPGLLNPALIAWVLSIPAFDTLSLFVYRLSQRRSPFSADRRHMHYLICDRGAKVETSVNIIHGLTLLYAFIGVVAFALISLPPVFLMPIWIASFVVHFAITFGAFKDILRRVMGTY
jgi:UDP-GlcNAc:undecaprenyl-phosphate GlcNAc-1-phosphate transferase